MFFLETMFIKIKKTIISLNWLFIGCSYLSSAEDKCQVLFHSARAEIQYKVNLNKREFIKNYKGQKGYLRFTEELKKSKSMRYVFTEVYQILTPKEKKELEWQFFQGIPKEFRELSNKILDPKGNIKTEFLGKDGYALFADKYYEGNMLKAYTNLSAVLDKKIKRELEWQQFNGTTIEFRNLRSKILDSKGNIKTEFLGMEGYAQFADAFYNGDMKKAYLNLSAVLDKKAKQELYWKGFRGTTTEFKSLRDKILDSEGNIKTKFLGMEGYAQFADAFYNGDMSKTYRNLSAILDKIQKQKLNWQKFQGSTTEFRSLRSKILDSKGNIKINFLGMSGCARFADKHYDGDMAKAYINISAVLDKTQKQKLNWQKFQGSAEAFRNLTEKILDTEGNIKTEFLGMEGYAQFADAFYNGDMSKTYLNISAVLDQKTKQELYWQQFQGTTTEFRELRNKILDTEGNIKPVFLGKEGYTQFADAFYNGDMSKTYKNISAILDKKTKQELYWQQFQGTTKEFRELRSKILDLNGNIITKFLGTSGYARFANAFYNGDMSKTYINISAVLDQKTKQELYWQQFQGTTKEFRELRNKILDSKGNIKTQFLGMSGYLLLADTFYNGNMLKAFKDVSAVLDKKTKQELHWQQFQGTTKEFRNLRNKFLDSKGNIKTQFLGMSGYILLADAFYNGDMKKAHINISTLLNKKGKQRLNWRQFPGTTTEFRNLRSKILDSKGNIKTQFMGMSGYILLADTFYNGDMIKTYKNISAILDKKEKRELHWQQFQGTTTEFKKLRDKILDPKGNVKIEFLGMKGQAQFADTHQEGDMAKTYKNISTVLGGAQAIEQSGLGWKVFQGSVKQFYALKDFFKAYDIESLKGEKGQKLVATEVFNGDEKKACHNVSILREELLDNPSDFPELRWLRDFDF